MKRTKKKQHRARASAKRKQRCAEVRARRRADQGKSGKSLDPAEPLNDRVIAWGVLGPGFEFEQWKPER